MTTCVACGQLFGLADDGGEELRAVVADGGLPLTEVDTKTMRVRAYSNLYVTGDLLHVTRPSGGYSLQLAWTTGYVAGSHA